MLLLDTIGAVAACVSFNATGSGFDTSIHIWNKRLFGDIMYTEPRARRILSLKTKERHNTFVVNQLLIYRRSREIWKTNKIYNIAI